MDLFLNFPREGSNEKINRADFFASAFSVYEIDAEIYKDNSLIAAPGLIVYANRQASVEFDKLFHLTMTVTPIDGTRVSLTTDLKLAGERISPCLVAELGQPAKIAIGNKALHVTVNKSDSDKSPARK